MSLLLLLGRARVVVAYVFRVLFHLFIVPYHNNHDSV